eukprot:TRINITY_DN9079_c0_g1_i1.p1 TRINITY_DN9079_c0_g1~~TRINITY_DN9079_c0_g1_i1.p1  ORF type:complete len:253 (-),score=12.13 TRINITY_DN9079_c0_g1_i1:4-762(-)
MMEDQYFNETGLTLDTVTWEWTWVMNTTDHVYFQLSTFFLYCVVILISFIIKNTCYKYTQPSTQLRTAHSLLLSILSLFMGILMVIHVYEEGRFSSPYNMACKLTPNEGLYGWANMIYVLSKIWEWGDTMFLILFSKPLIFLHVFHHMTTFTMAALTHNLPVGGFAFINCFVHVVMYFYYAFPVRSIRKFITVGQLSQFVVVLSINTIGYFSGCYDFTEVFWEWLYCEFVVVVFFFFFLWFFKKQYLKRKYQ